MKPEAKHQIIAKASEVNGQFDKTAVNFFDSMIKADAWLRDNFDPFVYTYEIWFDRASYDANEPPILRKTPQDEDYKWTRGK